MKYIYIAETELDDYVERVKQPRRDSLISWVAWGLSVPLIIENVVVAALASEPTNRAIAIGLLVASIFIFGVGVFFNKRISQGEQAASKYRDSLFASSERIGEVTLQFSPSPAPTTAPLKGQGGSGGQQ